MPYPIDKKFVIAVSSSALFDLTESDSVFRQHGIDKYREYQEKRIGLPILLLNVSLVLTIPSLTSNLWK